MLSNLEKYELLNSIIPYFNQTEYPYNKLTKDKIIETQQEIELVYQHNDLFFASDRPKQPRQGGGETKKISVLFYDLII